jgi:hypothetical protein
VIHWINLAKFLSLRKTAQFLEWYLGILFQVVFYVAVAVAFIGFIRLIRRGSYILGFFLGMNLP